MSPRRILFVCTGNTCRSPMAEGLARLLAVERSLNLSFESAGVLRRDGYPATDNARAVLRARGGDIDGHRSRQLGPSILAEADLIIAMEEEHRLAVSGFQEAAGKEVLLLSEWAGETPLGPGIDDPVGASLARYQATAEEIESYLVRALDLLADES